MQDPVSFRQSAPVRPTRREAIAAFSSLALALHQESGFAQQRAGTPRWQVPLLRTLRLQTHLLGELKRFYAATLGLRLVEDGDRGFAFQAGATRIEFTAGADGSRPFYHFAFNIPENKIETARRWLGRRVPILRHAREGSEVIHFAEWDAHSLFFDDPAGNLVEFIARHTLHNAAPGEFATSDLLCASEIGIVPVDQAATFAAVRDRFQLPAYLGSRSFLGDEQGIVIVIPREVKWIPRFEKSGIAAPTVITIAGSGGRSLSVPEGPFQIDELAP